jgi:hypothetical protein
LIVREILFPFLSEVERFPAISRAGRFLAPNAVFISIAEIQNSVRPSVEMLLSPAHFPPPRFSWLRSCLLVTQLPSLPVQVGAASVVIILIESC